MLYIYIVYKVHVFTMCTVNCYFDFDFSTKTYLMLGLINIEAHVESTN
jgi:hypothetical protein